VKSLAMDDLWPRLSRDAAVSILSDVPPANDPHRLVRRVLLAQDLRPGAEAGGRLAESIARRSGALLDVVAVVDGFSEIFLHENRALIADPDRYLHALQAALEVRVALARLRGVRCLGTLLVGAPPLELARHAAGSGADLMVLTSSRETLVRVQSTLRWRALTLPAGVQH
jgi:nucleotide-binding universal stress UspA family protein